MTELENHLKGVLRFHIRNAAPRRDIDNDSIDDTWSKGFDHGYESGRLSLIRDIIGLSEYDRLVNEARNE